MVRVVVVALFWCARSLRVVRNDFPRYLDLHLCPERLRRGATGGLRLAVPVGVGETGGSEAKAAGSLPWAGLGNASVGASKGLLAVLLGVRGPDSSEAKAAGSLSWDKGRQDTLICWYRKRENTERAGQKVQKGINPVKKPRPFQGSINHSLPMSDGPQSPVVPCSACIFLYSGSV